VSLFYVKKPECPARKGGPARKSGDEWPWGFGGVKPPTVNGFFYGFPAFWRRRAEGSKKLLRASQQFAEEASEKDCFSSYIFVFFRNMDRGT
jgi:hypothetical protein